MDSETMTYKVLLFYFCIGVATCNLTNSRHNGSSKNSHTTISPNIKHGNNSLEITSTVTSNITTEKDTVELMVYYETLCPYSVSFFTERLRPAVENLTTHLNVHLIPYGYAQTISDGGSYKFTCQHGAAECYGNKVHACVVDVLQNNTQAVLFNACLMDYSVSDTNTSSTYASTVNSCTEELDLHVDALWDCVNGERGPVLLKNYGEDTHALKPPYVPYIVLDGSSVNQRYMKRHLISIVCSKLNPTPTVCHS